MRVLPDQIFLRNFRSEVADFGSHIAVSQLEPGAGEGIRKRFGVLVEAARDGFVDRVEAQRQVSGGHHRRVLLRRVVRIGNHVFGLAVFRLPLLSASRAFDQFPLVAKEHVEVAHVPLGGVGFPGAFDAAGCGMNAHASAQAILPAQSHFFQRGGFGFGSDQFRVACAVRLAEGMSTGDERDGFFIVHRHAGESLTHIDARSDRIRFAVGTFGVDIDQAHLHGSQRILQIAFAAVAFVAQPGVFVAPVDIFLGLPDVGASPAKTEGLETHRLQRHVARQNHQVSPGEFVAIFLFDGPEQAARLVEVDVVGPAVERRKTLVAGAAAAASIRGAIGAGAVPCHADHQSAVVTPVSGPPLLRVGHQLGKVFLDRSQVELLEFFGVIEIGIHRVGSRRVLVQDVQVQLIGPPIAVGCSSAGRCPASVSSNRTFAFFAHFYSPFDIEVNSVIKLITEFEYLFALVLTIWAQAIKVKLVFYNVKTKILFNLVNDIFHSKFQVPHP